MLEQILKTLWIIILILVGFFVAISCTQLTDLETRVTALEEDAASWDITIVRPTTE